MKPHPNDWLIIIYQIIIITFILSGVAAVPHAGELIACHAAIIIAALLMNTVKTEWLRIMYPLLILPFLFYEITLLDRIIFNHSFDPLLAGIDHAIFKTNIGITFCQQFPSALFSEVMHCFYFSYYLLIVSMGCLLYFQKTPQACRRYFFILLLAFFLHYIFFIIFPVNGPKSYFTDLTPAVLPGYIITPLTNYILDIGGIPSAAFPSSHVAVALLVFFFARSFNGPVRWIYFILFAGLAVSTVYVREHYFVDVIGGIVSGSLCFVGGVLLYDTVIQRKDVVQ